tara:strand:- start:262 stop:747 length:486 start_codon:yes stop_codon:yes gene_type:complete
MKIIGIVGWKNSGKTFLVSKIINKLKTKNYRVASIKHAHHEFDIDHKNTDSYIHREAGSSQVIVSSSKRWVKITELENSEELSLNTLINQLNETDIVIVEGFKNENHPKIEIIKTDNNNYLFNKILNVKAIISEEKINTDLKQFKKNEIDNIVKFILKDIK